MGNVTRDSEVFAAVVGVKEKGLGRIKRVPSSKEGLVECSILVSAWGRGHFHRTIQKKRSGRTPTPRCIERRHEAGFNKPSVRQEMSYTAPEALPVPNSLRVFVNLCTREVGHRIGGFVDQHAPSAGEFVYADDSTVAGNNGKIRLAFRDRSRQIFEHRVLSDLILRLNFSLGLLTICFF